MNKLYLFLLLIFIIPFSSAALDVCNLTSGVCGGCGQVFLVSNTSAWTSGAAPPSGCISPPISPAWCYAQTTTSADYIHTADDNSCDAYLGAGTGDCAVVDANIGGFFDGIYCPSLERKGSTVTAADCVVKVCDNISPNASIYFNFNNQYFAEDLIPEFNNTNSNQSFAFLNQYINFSTYAFDDDLPPVDTPLDSIWFQYDFVSAFKDRENVTYGDNKGGTFGGTTGFWRAECFKSPVSGYLTNFTLVNVNNTANKRGNATAQIRTSTTCGTTICPTNTILFAQNYSTTPYSFRNYSFNTNIPYTANVSICIVTGSPFSYTSKNTLIWFYNSSTLAYNRGVRQYSPYGTSGWATTLQAGHHLFEANIIDYPYVNSTPVYINATTYFYSIIQQLPGVERANHWQFCANDTAGQIGCSGLRTTYTYTFSDSIVPSVYFSARPVSDSKLNGEFILHAGYGTDNLNLFNLSLSAINDTQPEQLLCLNETSNPTMYLSCYVNSSLWETNATVTFILRGCDGFNNCNSTNYSATIDHGYPISSGEQVIPYQVWYRNGTIINFTINVTDLQSGIDYASINLTNLNGTGIVNMTMISGNTGAGNYSVWNIQVLITNFITQYLMPIIFYFFDTATPQENIGQSEIYLSMDNNAPYFDSLSYTNPPIEGYIEHSLRVLDDESGLSTCILSENNSDVWVNYTQTLTGSEDYCSFTVGYTNATTSAFYFTINDSAGNVNTTDLTYVTVLSAQPPQISFDEPTPESGLNYSTNHLINISITEGDNPMEKLNFTWYKPYVQTLDKDLIALYHFNSNLNDTSGNDNNITPSDTITPDPYITNTGQKLGEGAYTTFGAGYGIANNSVSLNSITQNGTWAFWIYPTITKNANTGHKSMFYYTTIANSNGYYLNFVDNWQYALYFTQGSGGNLIQTHTCDTSGGCPGGGPDAITDDQINTWQHFVIVKNGSSVKFYKNGSEITLDMTYGSHVNINTTSSELDIGGYAGGQNLASGDMLDEVAMWNRSLSPSEVLELYNNQSGKQINNIPPQKTFDIYDRNLVGMYNFDSFTGLNDTSVYSNNGTNFGDVFVNDTGGKYGGGLQLDGNGDYVLVSSSNSLNAVSAVTLIAWVKSSDNSGSIISKDGVSADRQYVLLDGGYASAYIFENPTTYSTASSTTLINDSNWHFVAATLDSATDGKAKIYVDGILEGTAVTSIASIASTTQDVYIGDRVQTNAYGLAGILDEVRIFNRSLSSDEILMNYKSNLDKIGAGKWNFQSNQSNLAFGDNYTYNSAVCDGFSNCASTETRNLNITNPAGVDNEYPQFSNLYDNNASLVDSGIGLFNVTIDRTNGTAFLEINEVNYSATNLASNIYNISASLSAGTYQYYWGAWGNGTSNNYNTSDIGYYTVNVSVNPTPLINFTSPTPSNNTNQLSTSIYVNMSSSDDGNIYTFVDFNKSLYSWFKFDYTGENDSSSHGFNLTQYNNPLKIAGKFGNASHFDGITQYYEVKESNNSQFDLPKFTISLWAERNGTGFGGSPSLIGNGNSNGYVLSWLNNGDIVAYVATSPGSFTPSTYNLNENNKWYHIVMVYNGTGTQLYINSTLRNSTNAIINYGTENYTLKIGRYDSTTGVPPEDYFNGSIDDVLIFNRVLNQSEVSSLYDGQTNQYRNSFDNLAIGNYTIKGYATDNLGQTNSTEERRIQIYSISSDTQPPYFIQYPTNATIVYGNSYITQFNASDETGLSCFFTNDTHFSVNCSGYFNNNTALGVGLYYLNLTINDTSNNQNTTYFWVNVTRATGSVFAYINNSRNNFTSYNNSATGYNNLWLNGSRQIGEGNIQLILNGTTINGGGTILSNQSNVNFGYYNFTAYLAQTQNYTSAIEYFWINITATAGDVTPPSVIFNTQIPSDITSTNIWNIGVNITYNITDETLLNLSSIKLYHKSNSTTRDIISFVNGSGIGGFIEEAYKSNISSTFLWNLADDDIYPITSNLNPEQVHNTIHSAINLNTQTSFIKTQLLNVTNTTRYNFLEVMVNASTSANTLQFYYCNSSYSSGNINTNPNCVVATSWNPTPVFNYTDNQSSYKIAVLPINTTSGTLAGIKVTETSYFLLRGSNTGGGRFVYYVPETSRTGAIQTTTNNGVSWTSQTYTTDIQLHQFSGNSSIYYYACANDSSNNQACSSVRSDLFDLGGLPPTVLITSPIEQQYTTNISINYSAMSPNGYPIINYSVYLLNASLSINSTIKANTSLQSVNFNITGYDGEWIVKVVAEDNMSQFGFGFSNNFTILNILGDTQPPYFTTIPANQTITYGDNFAVDYYGADETLFDSFYLGNWTDYFNINQTGHLNNKTSLPVGTYTINITINDSSGNVNKTWYGLTVNKATGLIYAYVNNTRNNFTSYNNSATGFDNLDLNCSLITGQGIINATLNGTKINAGDSPLYNQTNVPFGYYNFTCFYDASQNYTAYEEYFWINITATTPAGCVPNMQNTTASAWLNSTCINNARNQTRNFTEYDANNCGFVNVTYFQEQLDGFCGVNITNCRNLTGYANQSFSQTITGTGATFVYFNFTNTFNISYAGLITNISSLETLGIHYRSITFNNTEEQKTCEMWINITQFTPSANQCGSNYTVLKTANSGTRPYGRLCWWLDFR